MLKPFRQAFKDHKIVDVFYKPGECDLTANVDFSFLQEAMSGLSTVMFHGPITQAEFLENMGLQLRLSRLLEMAGTEHRRSEIQIAAKRLVDHTGMGIQYQFMGMTNIKNNDVPTQEVWPFVPLRNIFTSSQS